MLPKDLCNFRVGLGNPLGVLLLGLADNPLNSPLSAEPAAGVSQSRSMASTTRTRELMAHLRQFEYGVGRVLQGCHAAAMILNVVEVVLDRLANDVGPAAVKLLGRRIQFSTKGIGQLGPAESQHLIQIGH